MESAACGKKSQKKSAVYDRNILLRSLHPHLRSGSGKNPLLRTRQPCQRNAAVSVAETVFIFSHIRLSAEKFPDPFGTDCPVFLDLHTITFFDSYLTAGSGKKQDGY